MSGTFNGIGYSSGSPSFFNPQAGFSGIATSPAVSSELLASIGAGGTGIDGYQMPESLQGMITDLNGMPTTDKWGDRLKLAGGAVNTLGGLAQIYMNLKATKLAAADLKFQKQAYRDNLAASTQGYNTALQDRANNRANQYGDPAYAAKYYEANKLTPKGI